MINKPLSGTDLAKLAKARGYYHSHAVEAGTYKLWLNTQHGSVHFVSHLEKIGYEINSYLGYRETVATHPITKQIITINHTYDRQFNDEPYCSVFVHKTIASKRRQALGLDDEYDDEYGT